MTTLRGVASVEDAYLARIAEMPENFRACRSGQHWMLVVDAPRIVDSRHEEGIRAIKGEQVYAKQKCECQRCGKVRWDYFRITSRRGHQLLQKIGAYYEKLEGYDIEGLGNVPGARGLVLGLSLELEPQPTRGRGRPRKGAAS